MSSSYGAGVCQRHDEHGPDPCMCCRALDNDGGTGCPGDCKHNKDEAAWFEACPCHWRPSTDPDFPPPPPGYHVRRYP